MQLSFSKNYIKIYLFQIISIILGFVSLFVVVPFLSSNQSIYGVYSICISISIFLSYADLGFLGAAQKYATESYSRGDKDLEVSLLGFAHFILLSTVLLISAIFLYLSTNPEQLITGLTATEEVLIAKWLLIIQAISAPVIVLQRMAQMIFCIRLEEYNVQKLVIAGNIIKIASVFYFFTGGRYNIVGYYFFLQFVSLLVALASLWLAKKKYNYPLALLLSNFRFSKKIFAHTRSLAFSSLFVTAAWVAYYELDSVSIGKLIGAQGVALYAIGLTLLGFIRSMLGVLYSPFSTRFNYFVGQGQVVEFSKFYLHVVKITFPLVVFPMMALAVMSRALIISWVGNGYSESADVAVWLILCNVLSFVSYPAGMMVVANEKITQMYWQSALMVIIFWGGIVYTIENLGIESFARFKFLSFIINGVIYIFISSRFLNISVWKFIKQVVGAYIPAIVVMLGLLFLVKDIYIGDKSVVYLLVNVGIILASVCIALSISLIFSKELRQYTVRVFNVIFNK
jgi:O-antigen/teichoic acid export membrane protein